MWKTGPSHVDDARGVLPAVLQQQQAVVEQLVDRRVRDDADDSAHIRYAFCCVDARRGPSRE